MKLTKHFHVKNTKNNAKKKCLNNHNPKILMCWYYRYNKAMVT